MLVLGDERQDWLEQCLASLENEPINLHVLPGVRGHIGAGRAAGFATGEAEFVSFVDPDDWIEPGAVSKCLDAIRAANADLAWTTEVWHCPDGKDRYNRQNPHHLCVYRRSAITSLLPLVASCVTRSEQSMLPDLTNRVHVPEVGYHYRFRLDSSAAALKTAQRST
jgi:hypothetical protein